MGQVSGLRDLFVLLLGHYLPGQQSIVYLRDVVQVSIMFTDFILKKMSIHHKTNVKFNTELPAIGKGENLWGVFVPLTLNEENLKQMDEKNTLFSKLMTLLTLILTWILTLTV